jgi:hypothetical protein
VGVKRVASMADFGIVDEIPGYERRERKVLAL